MSRMTTALLALGAVLALAAPAAKAEIDPFAQAKAMQRGLNILGYDPLWTEPAKARFQLRHFKAIRDGGFSTVRINLQAFAHLKPDGTLDPAWQATLDRLVQAALDQGLTVILDEHDFNICGKDVSVCVPLLTAFWKQEAIHYKDAPDRVVFEILNEPNGQLDDVTWNKLMLRELALIRRSNPTRNVIVGPAFWNSPDHLEALSLPEEDRHLIVTVHYYAPMSFTHQGASWVPEYAHRLGVDWGSQADLAKLNQDFDAVDRWSQAHRRPIFVGEFGAYDKAAMPARVRYTSAVARAAEARGWAWAYWQFDSDFIAWDMAKDRWVEPIRKALVPES